ncbi:MAG: hypothetical protein PHT81_05725 [Endomicrobiaceae bacterium]|nr:hypothetical protein [Endomicrobiaceae bacterium]MDD3923100.1 hypothetical protein [Endomicrobiaceae bacterium]
MDNSIAVIILTNICSLATLFLIRKNTEDSLISTLYISLKNKILLRISSDIGKGVTVICQRMAYNKQLTDPNFPFFIKEAVEEVMTNAPNFISDLRLNEKLYHRISLMLDIYVYSLIGVVLFSILFIYKHLGKNIYMINNHISIILIITLSFLLISIILFYYFKSGFRKLCSNYGVNEIYAPKESIRNKNS